MEKTVIEPQDSCRTCRYRQSMLQPDRQPQSICRRYPPQLVAFVLPVRTEGGLEAQPQMQSMPPAVDMDWWCGEWAPTPS